MDSSNNIQNNNEVNSKLHASPTTSPSSSTLPTQIRRRRNKRDRQESWDIIKRSITNKDGAYTEQKQQNISCGNKRIIKKKKRSKMTSKHADDAKSGGMDALLPSLVAIIVLAFMIMAKMGFRGRATVAGIDLGTTNSVVCVQQPPSSSAAKGEIICIPDPVTNSPVIPSVVSFLDNHYQRSFRLTKEEKEIWSESTNRKMLVPHPVDVIVGQGAKERINSHPHHTIYHAKRIIGREYTHESIKSMKAEVDFNIVPALKKNLNGMFDYTSPAVAAFRFPYHMPPPPEADDDDDDDSTNSVSRTASTTATLWPSEIGSYIIHHLRKITRDYLQHDNIQSIVIAIPAKFEPSQRDATIQAFELTGLKVARILEEPTAAALAYGLHKRSDVHYVMVYDFGGGTLDISLLYISEGGYIEVLGSDGDEQLGGADFDAAVAHWLLEKKGGAEIVNAVMASLSRIEKEMIGKNDNVNDVEDLIEELCPKLKETPLCTISSMHTIGERMKIGLSSHPNEVEAVAEETCYRLPSMEGSNVESNVPNTAEELCDAIFEVKLSLTLEEYDLAVDNLYKRSLLPIQRLLKDLNLQKEEIDEVVMVGGTTRMPQIREFVRKELEKERLNTHIDPDLTVAYGAASVID